MSGDKVFVLLAVVAVVIVIAWAEWRSRNSGSLEKPPEQADRDEKPL
jgi:hypothetical protein